MRNYLFSVLVGVFLLTSIGIASAQVSPEGTFVVNDNLNQCATLTGLSEDPPEGWRYMEEDYVQMFFNETEACDNLGYEYIGDLEMEEKVVRNISSEVPDNYEEIAGITPDSSLYSLDKGVEKVRSAFTMGEREEKEVSKAHARERLAEAKVMAEKGDRETTSELLSEYASLSGKKGLGPHTVSFLMGNTDPNANCNITKLDWNTFQFDATESYDSDGNITKYMWQIYDPYPHNREFINTTEPILNYTFDTDLDYEVRRVHLKVFDNEGGSSYRWSHCVRDSPFCLLEIIRPPSESVIWRERLDTQIRSSLSLSEDSLYVGSMNMHSIDKRTGQMNWNVSTGDIYADLRPCIAMGMGGDPQIKDGVLYQAVSKDPDEAIYNLSELNMVYALNLSNQEILWNNSLRKWYAYGGQPTIDNDSVYLGRGGSNFYKLDKEDGSVSTHVKNYSLFRYNAQGYSIAEDNVLYLVAADGFFALNKTDLSVIWKHKDDYWPSTKPIMWDDKIVVAGSSLDVFDKNGTLLWSHFDSGPSWQSVGQPIIDGDIAYFGFLKGPSIWNKSHTFYAFNLSSREPIWSYDKNVAYSLSKPQLHEGLVYFKSKRHLTALNTTNGYDIWRKGIDYYSSTERKPMVIDGDRLYLTTTHGFIYSFNLTKIEKGWASPEGYEGTQGPYAPGEANVTEDQQQNATSPYEEEEANVTEDTQQNATSPYD